jgi:hypothetical protein
VQPSVDRWLGTWLAAAILAVIIELTAIAVKARRAGLSLAGSNARRFAACVIAPLVAGAAITFALWREGSVTVIAPVWLLLYGAAVVTGGMFTVPVVRAMGVCFMAVGIAAMFTPAQWGNIWLGAGFGVLHIGFGAYIARNYGG